MNNPFQPNNAGQKGLCSKCGSQNSPNHVFCEKCGAPLSAAQQSGAHPAYSDPLLTSAEVDGISAAEWRQYIGPSSNKYLAQFIRQQVRGSKITPCFSAFFFCSLYFAYRKMWVQLIPAVLVDILNFSSNILYIMHLNNNPLLAWVNPSTIETTYDILSIGLFIVKILFMLFSVYWYRKKGAADIKNLRAENLPPNEYNTKLAKKGGVSYIALFIVIAVVMVAYTLANNYAAADIQAVYSMLL